ncbi:MAG: peptidase M16 [Flavobacteriales bacterium CG_4_10_14_0_2_um_filter_32_8]|nr:MAG: peptidase M16 [Flavobacteriales bacterium CG_4_10_14_0_2_um_filter_32_8]
MRKILSFLLVIVVVSGAFAQKLDRSKIPAAAIAPEIKLGKIEQFTLANGLQVFVVENHKLPKVAYSLSIDIDPVAEGDMAGYVEAAGQLMERGTKNRTKEQFDEQIDFIGATISTSSTGIYAASLKKHQEKLLDMMSDVLMNADFKQEELDKIKKQTISGITSSKDDPDAIARNARAVLLYGKDHPYGEIATESTVENITLDKCKTYYTTYFKPNVAYLAVVGDVTVAEVKPLIEKYFGSWAAGDVPVHKYRTPVAPEKSKVAVVHKEGAVQSVINITYPINLKQNNPDVIKAKVMNSILGGGSTARLFMNLREGHGYTYGAYSSISPDKLVGSFNANAKVRNEVTDSAVTEFLVELNRMINEKVTEEDLQGVKNYMTGTFAYTLQNPQTIASFAINTKKYNLPADYYANYLKNVAAVTIEDVQEMAKKYITPNNAIILVVGDKAAVSEKLTKFSLTKEVNFYDTYGNDYVEALKPAPAGMTAEMVLEKFVESKYGLKRGKELDKKLSKIKDVTVKMTASIQGQSINVTRYQKAPNKFAMTITMGTMVVQKQSFNGTIGKESGMQGTKNMEGDELADMKTSSVLHGDVNFDKDGSKYNLLGVESLDGKDAYKIEITKANGNKESEWYDVATNLQVKAMQVKDAGEEAGGAITIVSTFADYKVVNGINYAHRIVQSFGPQTLDMVVGSIEVNTKLGDDIFE